VKKKEYIIPTYISDDNMVVLLQPRENFDKWLKQLFTIIDKLRSQKKTMDSKALNALLIVMHQSLIPLLPYLEKYHLSYYDFLQSIKDTIEESIN